MRRLLLAAPAVALACSSDGGRPAATAPPAARVVAPPIVVERDRPLPPLARSLLAPGMHQNAAQLSELHAAVISLDHRRVRAAAGAILAEPRLARPSPSAGATINDELPDAFYALQDRMVSATRSLLDAAEAGDAAALATAYGELSASCVACHATYLAIPPELP